MASLSIFDVAEVVASEYPDDAGRPLLYTCTQLYRNEDVNRAVLLTSERARQVFESYILHCNHADRFRYVAVIVRGRPHLHLHQRNGRTISSVEFAVRNNKYANVCLLHGAGFTSTDRWADEHSFFSYLCEQARGDPAAAAAAARVFAAERQADGSWTFMGPEGGRSKDEGDTGLYRVCETGRDDILAYWLQQDRAAVISLMEEHYGDDGHTPFTAACYQAGITRRLTRSAISRKGATACAELLAALPECSPTAVGGLGMSNLYWACWAGRVDVVQRWLAHESVTAEWIVQGQGVNLEPLLAAVCSALRSGHIADEVKPAVRQCAGLVGCNPNCKPAAKAGQGSSQLFCAIDAGLAEVIEAWIRNAPSELASLMGARSYGPVQTGHTPFSAACKIAGASTSDTWLRTGAEACARLLASLLECTPTTVGGDGNSHLYWACWAGFEDGVQRWLEHESVTAEWMAHGHREEVQPLFRAVCSAFDHHALTKESSDLVPSVRQCAVLVGCNLVCKLVSTNAQVRPQLFWAIDFGLVEVVEALLQKLSSEDAAALQVQASGETGHTPFTAACSAAAQGHSMLSAGAAKCARLLASFSSCSPTAVGGQGYSNLYWACVAGLVDVVQQWLEHESVTEQWMAQEHSNEVKPLFMGVCLALFKYETVSEVEAAARQCAVLVGSSPKCRPDTRDGHGRTQLFCAVGLGLSEVVEAWYRNAPSELAAVVNASTGDGKGHTVFTAACSASVTRTVKHRAGIARCARLLASSAACRPILVGGIGCSYLFWACLAGLVDVVRTWLEHESVTEQWLAQDHEGRFFCRGHLNLLCRHVIWLRDYPGNQSPEGLAAVLQCASLLGTSGKCRPDTLASREGSFTSLHYVCQVGLDAVLEFWLRTARNAVLSVLHRPGGSEGGGTPGPFAAACDASVSYGLAYRAGASACVSLLAALPEVSPVTVGGNGLGNMYWACKAWSVDAVARWLQHESVTEAVLNTVPPQARLVDPILYTLCMDLCSSEFASIKAHDQIRQCAVLVGTSGKCSPSAKGRTETVPQLFAVCRAGLDEVLAAWLRDRREDVLSVLHYRFKTSDPHLWNYAWKGHTAFTAACATACGSEQIRCSCEGGHPDGGACVAHTAARRRGALACANLLAALPECIPDSLGGEDKPYSYWAEKAGVALASAPAGTLQAGGGAGAAGAEAGL